MFILKLFFALFFIFFAFQNNCYSKNKVTKLKKSTKNNTRNNIGEEIAQCAKSFLGTPYDTNPLGEYVAQKKIIYDKEVDCMYFVFRCTEIALGKIKNQDPILLALDMRFKTKGILNDNGLVENYEERYDYAEDMFLSGKWGKNITSKISSKLNKTNNIRIQEDVYYADKNDIEFSTFKNGDIVFLIKKEDRRVVNEIVGHLGFIVIEEGEVFLIHASGKKKATVNDGTVNKIKLKEYLDSKTLFDGIVVTRFEN